jgi:pimeloyl-ACP methyl ester carboxylesterase
MPHAQHGDVRIHYSVQGDGPPLLLHHGSASNQTSWIRYGYAKALREHYRLILIDARGHGQSDKPVERDAHSLARRVGDVTAVLDALRVERAHFLGYSMGGWIGFGMVRHAPERLLSLALGGAHPFVDPAFAELARLDPTDPDQFVRGMELVLGEPVPAPTRRLLLQNDLAAVMASLRERVPLEDVLTQISVPCWLFAGDADRRYELIEGTRRQIAGAELLTLPGLTHLGALVSSQLVLPGLMAFLRSL